MSDGDTEFRWQNRPRDIEFENEMISRMYMYLGGDEAREAGYVVENLIGQLIKYCYQVMKRISNIIHSRYL